ncbi:DmsC/YnfH family molybdoenzyme membrane anchor subunit [Pectobacterium sp. A5351]|uniref:DmsC/YnfH family molybdoenzyme membrane anchor subunit n=1 Tax=Pectobacterium sp. A5351 TaxID=2914983 RepID=UPI00232C6783|nr:DmsC/YnfH family molybdoenzyme membrane anchor subunit [Pectobacterium sp. A5351]WCG84643.1 dimethyl sulfoxide reductase anchor subunit [Pectobacterium sp. A5351]
MGMGLHEWPLILFTVIGQTVSGAFIILGLAILKNIIPENLNLKVHHSMLGLWLLMGVGFLLSMMHMGSPLRAFNSLLRIGHSPLSNEIAAGSLFFAFGGTYWLIALSNKFSTLFVRIMLVTTMLLSLLFIIAITRVYQIETVPTWNNAYTTLSFILTACISGPVLASLLLRIAGVNLISIRFLPLSCIVAVIFSAMIIFNQTIDLSSIETSAQKALDLVPNYKLLMSLKIILLISGIGIWLAFIQKERNPSVSVMVFCFFAVFFGELIGRGVFYGLHMTVGLFVVGV